MKQPLLVQSHRGGGAHAPENTIESFTAAWELGLVPEADLRSTRDGVIVAFHDATFARVFKADRFDLYDKGVQDVTFAELATLDVGSWRGNLFAGQRVCSLVEIFALMQGHPRRRLYLDIKAVRLPRLADLVLEYDLVEQVILAAPDEQPLRDWSRLVPYGNTLLWMGVGEQGSEATLRQRLERLRDEAFAGISQLQVHVEVIRRDGDWEFTPSLEFFRRAAAILKAAGVLFQALPWRASGNYSAQMS